MSIERIRLLREQGDHEEAMKLALQLVSEDPSDPQLHYEAACVHDYLGYEAQAVPFYRGAIAAGLAGEPLQKAYLGLGSTYRALGCYRDALATFDEGLAKFPDASELKVFRAMALYNVGEAKEAVASLLTVIVDTTSDEAILSYRRAITLYAEDLDQTWLE
jgi:tetratricopeptide (TPR) repeat protein